ncbi:hypothetical protein BLA39750_04280 [Burkholderia lata]|uniref:Uncharacterized protein n=1 Tax=Burkholderia lata (strain ATCC 17760 / DSM 23089 / LMG 22485 / NCIMB 9086 / R18194 / 383) TaxID=482957 RepID=A0A6P2Z199_BURL3|nr:hypothetical protein BLA39750_04280 [Burkholderia lata]
MSPLHEKPWRLRYCFTDLTALFRGAVRSPAHVGAAANKTETIAIFKNFIEISQELTRCHWRPYPGVSIMHSRIKQNIDI